MKKIKILIVFLVLFSFFTTGKVNAQDGVGISVSPVRIEDLVDPGQILSKEIIITNESSNATTLYAYLKDFKADDESGTPKLIAPGSEEGYYLASWIDITSEGVQFLPGERKTIPFIVKVPQDIGPGGYYGGIFFGTKAPKLNVESEDKGAGMSIAQQTGALLLLQVKGDVNEDADIREFNTSKEVYGTPFDVNYIVRIQNRGNVHVKPIGEIRVENMFGKEVSVITFNDSGGNVLPNSIRKYEENWKGDFGFGRYRAKLGVSYGTSVNMGGQGRQTLYIEKFFWIIPWKIVGPAIGSLVATFLIFFFFLRTYRNRAVRRAMQKAGIKNVSYINNKNQAPSQSAHMGMVLIVVFIVMFILISAAYFLFFS